MSVKDNVQREANSASEKLREAKDTAAGEIQGLAGKAQDAASHYVDEGRQVAAGHLTTFADAVRKASDELAEKDQGVAARLVTEAADGLEKVANSVSGASVDEMMSSVNAFARQNPGAFVIGSVLAGIALGRFAKASAERPHGHGELPAPRGTGSGTYRGPSGSTGSSDMNYPGATRGTTYPTGNRPGAAPSSPAGSRGAGTSGSGSSSTGTPGSAGSANKAGGNTAQRVGPASTTPTNR